jgi:hypothetical protein
MISSIRGRESRFLLTPAPLSLSITEKQIRFERASARFVLACQINDISVVCYRYIATLDEELAHFLAGRSEIDPRLHRTMHQDRLAKDYFIVRADGTVAWEGMDYQKFGELAEGVGLRWGGRFTRLLDYGHVEYQAST